MDQPNRRRAKPVLFLILLGILSISVCACGPKETNVKDKTKETIRFTFTNEIEQADVWIIPDTEENHKTSVWGTATVRGALPGTAYSVEAEKSENGEYLLRMIDTEGMYYESKAFSLADDFAVIIRSADWEAELEIIDAEGNTVFTGAVFAAAL